MSAGNGNLPRARELSAETLDEWEALTDAIRNASPDRFPLIAGLNLDVMSGAGPARAAWAFEALANGILMMPGRRTPETA